MNWFYAVVPREIVLPMQPGNFDLQTPPPAGMHAERPVTEARRRTRRCS